MADACYPATERTAFIAVIAILGMIVLGLSITVGARTVRWRRVQNGTSLTRSLEDTSTPHTSPPAYSVRSTTSARKLRVRVDGGEVTPHGPAPSACSIGDGSVIYSPGAEASFSSSPTAVSTVDVERAAHLRAETWRALAENDTHAALRSYRDLSKMLHPRSAAPLLIRAGSTRRVDSVDSIPVSPSRGFRSSYYSPDHARVHSFLAAALSPTAACPSAGTLEATSSRGQASAPLSPIVAIGTRESLNAGPEIVLK